MKIQLTFSIKPGELAAIRLQFNDRPMGYVSDVMCVKMFLEETVQAALVDLMFGRAMGESAVA